MCIRDSTNTPPAGAFRGYGVPQGYWPLDRHMEKIARALNLDPIEFRLKNAIHPGEYHPFSTAWNEGREPRPEIINTVGLEQCVAPVSYTHLTLPTSDLV